jgi:type VI secretion system protein ImpG
MSDELLPYYNRELAFLRRLGAQFAEDHPKIAGRLRLSADTADDPHVERLIEAAAYLNARTRFKLDDDFPEISDALLNLLYPHYQAPIPSMAVAQFTLDRGQGELVDGFTLPRQSQLETEPIEGEPCRFQTCYALRLMPVELVSAEQLGQPFSAPATPASSKAAAVVRLVLRCFSKEMTFAQLAVNSLRFFLKGQPQHVYALYESLLNHTLCVSVANASHDRQPAVLKPHCVRPVGFDRAEGLLPYPDRSFLGYRLLTEYFAFPEKFLFVDVTGLDRQTLARAGREIEIYFYLNRSSVDLEQNIVTDTFRLNCTPIVNLYRQQAEPIALTHRETIYRVVPDARRPSAHEIYSVDRVVATSPQNVQAEYRPFYSVKHGRDAERDKMYYYAVRQPAGLGGKAGDGGTEVYLNLVDMAFRPSSQADWTLDVETTCLNRDLPHRLPLGEGQGGLRLTRGAPVTRIECVSGRPTRTLRPSLRKGAVWKLISHLSLNHLSLTDTSEGADALREILKLYDFADSSETRAIIDAVVSVVSRRVTGRLGNGFCRGMEVTVHLDEARFAGSGAYLFASVLERFLGLYCNINSFCQFIATSNKREGALGKWPPRAGEQVLL